MKRLEPGTLTNRLARTSGRIVGLLLCLVALWLFAACGDDDAKKSTKASAKTPAELCLEASQTLCRIADANCEVCDSTHRGTTCGTGIRGGSYVSINHCGNTKKDCSDTQSDIEYWQTCIDTLLAIEAGEGDGEICEAVDDNLGGGHTRQGDLFPIPEPCSEMTP